jgi:ribonuclease E
MAVTAATVHRAMPRQKARLPSRQPKPRPRSKCLPQTLASSRHAAATLMLLHLRLRQKAPVAAEVQAPVAAEAVAAVAPVAEPAQPVQAEPAAAAEPQAAAVEPVAETAAPAPAVAAPKAQSYALPIAELQALAAASGLEWINSDAEKIAAVQAAIAAEPKPVRIPRERPPVVVLDEGPLILVETRKDLSLMQLPFEKEEQAAGVNA